MALLLGIVALPLIEIALFVQIGGAIGLWATLAFVILSFALGAMVLQNQGLHLRDALTRATYEARDPAEPLAHGALIAVAGILLMLPGFLTSACGLLLLIPPLRGALLAGLARRMRVQSFGFDGRSPASRPSPEDDIIDGEFSEVRSDRLPPEGHSGWTRD